jgi:hypothetical protein
MGLLANFKIRTKVLVASLPLVLMVLVAALYASIEMNRIDTRYSELIDRDVKALNNLMNARVMDNRYHQLLYQEIAEPNLDKMRSIDADLDKTAAEFYSSTDEAKRQSPNLTSRIKPAEDLFDQVVSESRPVRGAALMSDNAKALELMRGSTEPRLLLVRQALIEVADGLHARVDQQSVELTARTHRTILITWIVIVLGLAASFAIALSIVQVEVVKVVLSFRGRILDVAQGRLDQPIANLDRPNEIGEMSRALQTLQVAARERETQGWVKAEVAATTERLQTAEDFTEFAASRVVAVGLLRGERHEPLRRVLRVLSRSLLHKQEPFGRLE